MSDTNVCDQVHTLLNTAFTVDYLEVIDDTYRHRKHKQFVPGKYHVKIIISAREIMDIPLIQAHRMIYQALGEFMDASLHAVSIKIHENEPNKKSSTD